MWITRANVSTRNKCCPFGFTRWEKCLELEKDGKFLEAPIPKPPNPVKEIPELIPNCPTRFNAAAAAIWFQYPNKQNWNSITDSKPGDTNLIAATILSSNRGKHNHEPY